ncbi:type II secretion system F family protein [Patescibacteria group bacterium]|nr:type II secretion system F family protein [Patescibacteria group bacterium]
MLKAIRASFLRRTINREDKLFFSLNLALMLRAGISLPKAVETLAAQTKKKYWRAVLLDVRKRLMEGNSFEKSLTAYKSIFGVTFISMARVGELKGDLASILDTYVELAQKEAMIIQKVKMALAYPTVVLLAMVVLGIGAVTFIFPRIAEIFEEVDTQLPLITRIVIGISNILVRYGVVILILFILLILATSFAMRTRSGKFFTHMLILRVPILSRIIKQQNLARLSRSLGVLLASGIRISEALLATSEVVSNVHYKTSLLHARQEIINGNFVHTAFVTYPHLYPNLIIQIITVGEEAGVLDKVLQEIADFYERRVMTTLATLSTIVEPILILLMGAGVALMALSILLPIYSLTEF